MCDLAVLMRSVVDDRDAGVMALRSEQPVACVAHEMDAWLNQRLGHSVSAASEGGGWGG